MDFLSSLFSELSLPLPSIVLLLSALLIPLVTPPLRDHIMLLLGGITLLLTALVASSPTQILVPCTLIAQGFGLFFLLALCYGHKRLTLYEQQGACLQAAGAIAMSLPSTVASILLASEILSIGGLLLIWAARTPASFSAGLRYILFHLLAGSCLLCATVMGPMHSMGSMFLTLGLGINIALFPLGIWLPDAYRHASAAGFLVLSGFTTKASLWILLTGCKGSTIFSIIGMITLFFSAIAAFATRTTRLVLCHMMVMHLGGLLMLCDSRAAPMDLPNIPIVSLAILSELFATGLLLMLSGLAEPPTDAKHPALRARTRGETMLHLSLWIALAHLVACPLTTSFMAKHLLHESSTFAWPLLTLYPLLNTWVAVRLYRMIAPGLRTPIALTVPAMMSLAFLTLAPFCFWIGLPWMPHALQKAAWASLSLESMLPQLLIIGGGIGWTLYFDAWPETRSAWPQITWPKITWPRLRKPSLYKIAWPEIPSSIFSLSMAGTAVLTVFIALILFGSL